MSSFPIDNVSVTSNDGKEKRQASLVAMYGFSVRKRPQAREEAAERANLTIAKSQDTIVDLADTRSMSCSGIMPLTRSSFNLLLDIYEKYISRPGDAYMFKKIGCSTQANAYSSHCTGVGIPRSGRVNPGLRCNECQEVWSTENWRLREKVNRRGGLISQVLCILYRRDISSEDYKTLLRFKKTDVGFLNENGIVLREKVMALREFYNVAKVIDFIVEVCFSRLIANS